METIGKPKGKHKEYFGLPPLQHSPHLNDPSKNMIVPSGPRADRDKSRVMGIAPINDRKEMGFTRVISPPINGVMGLYF